MLTAPRQMRRRAAVSSSGAALTVRAMDSKARAIVAGAGGALGSAVLERALGAGLYAQVAVLADEPIAPALRGFVALDRATLDRGGWRADSAFVVFDRARGLRGREDAFHRPDPRELPALAESLRGAGVRRLLLVLPHAPALLPQALKAGLASLDEQAVAALGFGQLVILRPTQQASDEGAPALPHRIARAMLAQLRWMIPQRDQPVRPQSVAALALEIARRLPAAPAGLTRVVPPELVWQAAQPRQDVGALVAQWLDGGGHG
jgi:hypothetical protein